MEEEDNTEEWSTEQWTKFLAARKLLREQSVSKAEYIWHNGWIHKIKENKK